MYEKRETVHVNKLYNDLIQSLFNYCLPGFNEEYKKKYLREHCYKLTQSYYVSLTIHCYLNPETSNVYGLVCKFRVLK